MGAMAWGFLDNSPVSGDSGFLKFPTVCIVGFVPHLLILVGIIVCLGIYGLAVLISAFNLPAGLPEPSSIWERFTLANDNMQGSTQIRNVRLNMHEDFYTSLLRIGYAALTAASEAVFLNEGRNVVARRRTWLEEDRLTEIETARRRARPRASGNTSATRWDNTGGISFDIPLPQAETWESGYGKEQKIEKLKNIYRSHSQNNLGGVGAFHGASRVYHGYAFFRGIFYLISRWITLGLNKILERMGITSRPQWMVRLIGSNKKRKKASLREQQALLDFWILTEDGELELPEDDEFDVEKEMRKREIMHQSTWEDTDETQLDNKLYSWWSAGGSWGNQDESGDYAPSENSLDDNTSVISMQTNNDDEWEDDEDSDGRRTPTQREPYPRTFTRESTPLMETLLDTSSLARLLDPRDQESKNEARILAAHLLAEQEGRIMTRSRFRRQDERERARVLMPVRYHARSRDSSSNSNEKSRPTAEEEADILEKLILTRRQDAAARVQEGPKDSWETGAAGLGDDGPQCPSDAQSAAKSSRRSSGSDLASDARNSTLGFGAIFVINLPPRTDRRDALALMSSMTDLKLDYIEGVLGSDVMDRALPPPASHTSQRSGNIGSWRSHLNAIRAIVENNLDSALILEDDADWDVRIHDQMYDFAEGVRALTMPLAGTTNNYADPSYYDPLKGGQPEELVFGQLPKTVKPQISPYGDDWDVLWIGHCGTEAPNINLQDEEKAKKSQSIPRGRVVYYNDETVPQNHHLHVMEQERDPREIFPDHTRTTHHVMGQICSLVYAVSQRGARRILYEMGVKKFSDPYDIMLRDICEGVNDRPKGAVCLSVEPGIFNHHRPVGPSAYHSDISEHLAPPVEVAFTENIRYSARLALENYAIGSTELEDQWPDKISSTSSYAS
ncbi:uncharacterized protein BHQ10_005519 [Talaromyces amestolkiae]|uniref:Glycosyltransferase family 25 protein n=1 Tax=Talaromyces amestolkiae TaxID=1196081 RepID=A0A364L118_TALAM|nr:uncharacterized protein BHQ10_005519 [Talaromyces amestolkiae]RAO69507.1 hypothetical protein BHQ10_005519 [Talaromyces amestolkiae]